MKKSSKPAIYLFLSVLIVSTIIALLSIGIKLKLEQFFLQKDKSEKKYKDENQKKIRLIAEYQTVISEDKIIEFAKSDLGLIIDIESPLFIKYNKEKIDEINKNFKEKYEQ